MRGHPNMNRQDGKKMKLPIEHLLIADLQQKYRQTNLSKQRGYKTERQI